MTAIPRNPRVTELRELFRSLVALRATYEETGLEEVVSAAGNVWSLWDLEYLLDATQRLTQRQQQVITLCLVHNMREKDAAVAIGVAETNPVMMYATLGLQRLLEMIEGGELPRFVENPWTSEDRQRKHVRTVESLIQHIRQRIIVVKKCWLYPTRCAGDALLLVRSPSHPLGFATVSPLQLMFEDRFGPLPRGTRIAGHKARPAQVSLDCVNPEHAELELTPQRRREVQLMAARYNRMQRMSA
jgi:hypothetical protein